MQQTLVVTPAGTTTAVTSNHSLTYSSSSQTFTVKRNVRQQQPGTPSGGTVTFDISNGSVGADVSATVGSNGQASTTFTLDAGVLSKTYTITASYTGQGNFAGSDSSGTANGTLTVNQAPAITSSNKATFIVGQTGITFTIKTTGFPTLAATSPARPCRPVWP